MTEYIRCSGCGDVTSCKTFSYCDKCQQEATVPISKVKAKIEELRTLLKDNPTIPYDRQWVVVSVAIPALEDLLPPPTT